MNTEKNLFLMRNLYISLMAETIVNYGASGTLNKIEESKRAINMEHGGASANMLGITTLEDVFLVPSSIVECATWDLESEETRLTATCKGCKLVGVSKSKRTESPCRMYCLNPIEGMINSLKPDANFSVNSTMWENDHCEVKVTW